MVESHQVGRRERQVLDVVYQEASIAAARGARAFPPSFSPFRAPRLLTAKNLVNGRSESCPGLPVTPKTNVGHCARPESVRYYFHGRSAVAVTAPQDDSASRHEPEDVKRIKRRIENAEERS